MPSELPLEVRAELTRLRAIMYEPSSVWLATWAGDRRWLTDGYVMLDVTGSYALMRLEAPDPDLVGYQLRDGPYKLVASKGFEPRDTIPGPDLDSYFKRMDELCDWHVAAPTEWSVAEHPGKAMLWQYMGKPCLLGESTWTALRRNHPDCSVDYSSERNVFRFAGYEHDGTSEECAEDICDCTPLPFCFAAGIRVPEGQEEIAERIAHMEDDS